MLTLTFRQSYKISNGYGHNLWTNYWFLRIKYLNQNSDHEFENPNNNSTVRIWPQKNVSQVFFCRNLEKIFVNPTY